MNVSRLQLGAALTLCALVVVLAYSLLRQDPQAATLTSPDLQVLERANVPKNADEPGTQLLTNERVAVEKPSPVSVPAPPPLEKSKPADPRVLEREQWEKEFAGLKRSEIVKASEKLGQQLGELASEPLKTEFDAGRYEVIGHGKSDSSDHAIEGLVEVYAVQYRMDTDEIRKAVLPESQYPEFYAMRRKILWLENQAQQPERQD